MHDSTAESLRKQALKHGSKTVSRKAISKQSSLAGSRVNSRANSAVPSRNVSAANSRAGSEAGSGSVPDEDERPMSPTSLEALIIPEEETLLTGSWQEHLAEIITTIENRDWKTANAQTRRQALITYVSILRQHYCAEDISFRLVQLITILVKCIKAEDDVTEVALALRALSVTAITSPSSDVYESVSNTVKRAITDSSDIKVKVEAIQTFAIVSFYGDISDDEMLDNLAFFLEIVSTDGEYIDALDEPEPVAAALEAYGFLATLVDDISPTSEESLETFIAQLDSSSASVLIAAGENIALLYEKAYTPLEEEEDLDSFSKNQILTVEDKSGAPLHYIRRFDLVRDPTHLENQLTELQRQTSRSLSKTARKSLHATFADVLHSVQRPDLGPHYSTALDGTGAEYGSRMRLKATSSPASGKDGAGLMVATVDKWWLLHRHRALKEVLGGGFMAHYETNEAIFEALPIVFVAATTAAARKRGKSKGGRREARHGTFLEVENV